MKGFRLFPFLLLLAPAALGADSDGDGLDDVDEVLAYLPPAVADSDGDGLHDHLDSDMDGDGVLNTDECRFGGVSDLALINGGFEQPAYSGTGFTLVPESSVSGWDTSAPDNNIELWYGGFLMSPYEGRQIVELNANYASTLYQDVTTTYGDVYIYAFSHRGRSGTDTMRFSLSGIEVRTVSDGPGAWGRYGGVITIVDATTSFQFEAVASACGASCGNLLDDISFAPACDLDTDGDGTPDALDIDEDNDGVSDAADVCPGEDDALDFDGDGTCSGDPCPYDDFDDWDGDGVCGDVDLCAGFDDAQDMDSDTLPDGCDTDRDGDGWHEWEDCDEDAPLIGAALTYYPDLDGDGYGNTSAPVTTCTPGPVFTSVSGDCADADPSVSPATLETCLDAADLNCDGVSSFDDADGDGVCGPVDACAGYDDQEDFDSDAVPDGCDFDVDGDGAPAGTDCDDGSPSVGAPAFYFEDVDGDGYGGEVVAYTCSPIPDLLTNADDCDDGDAATHPGADETCLDTADLNCDRVSSFDDADGDGICGPSDVCAGYDDRQDLDSDAVPNGCDYDVDGDGELAETDCDDENPSVGGPAFYFEDADGDGYGGEVVAYACSPLPDLPTNSDDCDDGDGATHPGADETCLDAADLNCDGVSSFDDADADGLCANYDSCPEDAANDADADGVCESSDACPTVSDDQRDADADGLGDACDEDDDGDGTEDMADGCPLVWDATQVDTDEDGIGDACDEDDDNDGLPDTYENETGSDPRSPDTDRDGFTDDAEVRQGTDPSDARSLPPGLYSGGCSYVSGSALGGLLIGALLSALRCRR